MQSCKKIGITGGIGSGKSYVCRLLNKRGIIVYDCDSAAKRLMRLSEDLRQRLTDLIGPDTYINIGGEAEDEYVLNKKEVTKFLLASEANAHAIDAIVHPAVFRDFEESGIHWVESAILYDSGLYRLVDKVVVVTAPEEVRIQRVMQRDGITREKALEWIGCQWPQDELVQRADYEIVNDGKADLEQQIENVLKSLELNIDNK